MKPLYRYHPNPASSLNQIAKLIGEYQFQSILDLGCAGGFLLQALGNNWSGKIVGVEKDRYWAQFAPLSQYAKIYWWDLNKALPQNHAQLTVAADVLEHLENPALVLKKITSPWLIVSLPNRDYLPTSIVHKLLPQLSLPVGPLDSTHLHSYSFDQAENLLKNSGFKIQASRVTPAPILSNVGILFARRWPQLFTYQFIFVCKTARRRKKAGS